MKVSRDEAQNKKPHQQNPISYLKRLRHLVRKYRNDGNGNDNQQNKNKKK